MAHAQACNGQYCNFSLGNYTVQNDEWGLSSDPSGGQEIWPDGSGWYASMTWQYDGGGVKAYPSIVAGWNFGNVWTPSNDGFPVQISQNANLPTSTSWYTTGTFSDYDTAYDLFFSPSAGPSEPSAEMMVWLGESVDTPAGSQIASNVTLGGEPGTWNVWAGNVGWPVYSFVSTSTINNFSANLQPFIYYLAYTNKYLSTSWYVLDMQFGCEIQAASGEFFDTSFYGNANGNEGGGTTGGGTTGGGLPTNPPSNGEHTLTPGCATGSRLDDDAAATTNGNKIDIYQSNGTAAQNWNFALVGGSNQWNMAVLGPYCLDGGAAQVGTPTQLWGCNGTPDQDWVSGPAAQSGAYNFASKQSGLCLTVTGGGSANYTAVESSTCNGSTAQAWYID